MTDPEYKYLTYESLDEGTIAAIMLNRPNARNAQNRGLLVELGEELLLTGDFTGPGFTTAACRWAPRRTPGLRTGGQARRCGPPRKTSSAARIG
jgi:hypothetical protein